MIVATPGLLFSYLFLTTILVDLTRSYIWSRSFAFVCLLFSVGFFFFFFFLISALLII